MPIWVANLRSKENTLQTDWTESSAMGSGILILKVEHEKQEHFQAHCTRCKCGRMFVKHQVNHAGHLLATLLTGGLWAISWIAVCIEGSLRPWRCEVCGWHKPECRVSPSTAAVAKASLHSNQEQRPEEHRAA